MAGRVSVIIPTFNRAALVCRAVESVLNQTYGNIEVIVVDDGSTDDTLQRLARYGTSIQVRQQPNRGVCAARNNGICAATGDYIALLDSDDYWMPWKTELQVAAFERCPDVQMTYTDAAAVDLNGKLLFDGCLRLFYAKNFGYRSEEELFDNEIQMIPGSRHRHFPPCQLKIGDFSSAIFIGNFFPMSSVMLRKETLEQAGIFDTSVGNAGEDYEFFSRFAQRGKVGLLNVSAFRWGIGGGDHLHTLKVHSALANLVTMRRIKEYRGGKLDLPAAVVARRERDAQSWAGRALFDEGHVAEARPHLGLALRLGCREPRVIAYSLLSFFPRHVIDRLRTVYLRLKSVRAIAGKRIGVR